MQQPVMMQGQPMQPGQQMMPQQVIVVQGSTGPYQERDVKCCCCFPVMCGIYALAAYGLINIYNMIQFVTLDVGVTAKIITILVYLPEVVFYFFVVKYMMG